MSIHDWTRVIPGTFHHFHLEWISSIQRELNGGILPPAYYAIAEQVAGGLGPDILTLGNVRESGTDFEISTQDREPRELLATVPKTRFSARTEVEAYTSRQRSVVIRHRSGDSVVAVIEIVSPGNKANKHALNSLVNKAIEFLTAGIHLLIVDLFPPTLRDPDGIHGAIWEAVSDSREPFRQPKNEPLTLVSYCAGLELSAFIEPVAVGVNLPDMPMFLKQNGHVLVPLQKSYDTAFEGVPERWRRELL